MRFIPFFLAFAWGLNWPAVKIALSAFPPFTLRWVGLGGGGILLLLIALGQRRSLRLRRETWPRVVIGGIFTVAVFNVATALAQLNTSTSRAAVLTFTMPMMSAVLSWLVVGEKMDRRKIMALSLGLIGVVILAWPVLSAALAAHDARAYKGLVFPLVAAFGWAAGNVYLKRWPVTGDRIAISAWQLLIGATCGVIGALVFDEHLPDQRLSVPVMLALFHHIVLGTALAYWLWFILSERVSATVASLTTLMVPVVGVLSAMALVGDRPSATDWIGFLLVLGGAALIVLGPQLPGFEIAQKRR